VSVVLRTIALTSLLLAAQAFAQIPAPGSKVPDAATAIRIAVSAWEPIYGREQISKQAPYVATLASGVWTVQGTLPKGFLGGVATAAISATDGRVRSIAHGR